MEQLQLQLFLTGEPMLKPVLKWVGGKRQLLGKIAPLLPREIESYCEPFLGGAAVLFFIRPSKAIVNDLNGELIALYETIRDDVELLIEDLRKHRKTREYFYELRGIDRDPEAFEKLSKIERASRLIYLNRTCFNGIFRVNARGEFNTPFGCYKDPSIVNEPVLRAINDYLKNSDVSIFSEDFEKTLSRVSGETFVYFDPPYEPVSETANFTRYCREGFGRDEQEDALRAACAPWQGRLGKEHGCLRQHRLSDENLQSRNCKRREMARHNGFPAAQAAGVRSAQGGRDLCRARRERGS